MTVPLQVSLSLAFAVSCIVIAVVSFTPTYITGIDGVQATVDALRRSIDRNLEEALINYIAEPQDVNDILARELNMSLQGTTPEQQHAFKIWCMDMLKAKSNSLYIAFGTEDGGLQPNATTGEHYSVFLGCESVKSGGQETFYWYVRNATFGEQRMTYRVDYNTYEELERTSIKSFYDPRLRSWYTALSSKQGWTTTYLYSDASKFAVTSGKPWFSASGELLGVATTDYAVAAVAADTQVTRTFSTMLEDLEYGKTGAAMALDGRDGSVLGISWGESMVTNATGKLLPKSVAQLDFPMFRSVVKSLGGTKEAVLAHPVGQFEYGGRWVSVQDISDDYGFLMRVVVAIPEDDFMGEIKEQQAVSLGIMVALIVVVVACGIAFSTAIAGVVQELAENMEQCATMNLETVKESKPSNISEIRSMQSSFHQMHSNLVEYRNYLPQSVLLAGSDAEEDGSEPSVSERQMSKSGVSISAGTSAGASTIGGGRRENAKAVQAALRTGGLTKKMVSVALLNVRGFTAKVGNGVSKEQLCTNHEKYLAAVLETAKMSKGVVDGFQGDLVWATWNAASNCGTHATSCVTALWQLVTQRAEEVGIVAAAGTGPALCGNMGCTGMKKFTVIGKVMPTVGLLSKLNRVLDCQVLVEQRMCEEAGGSFYFRMRDVVNYSKSAQGQVEAHEVYEAKSVQENDEWMYQLEGAAESDPFAGYNAAFKTLANGRQEEAKAALRKWTGESPNGEGQPRAPGLTVGADFVKHLADLIEKNNQYARTEVPVEVI